MARTERLPITCTIIAHDEEDRIERCIRSVRDLVDEVVVVDSGSTDATVARAEALGARVIHRDWPGYGPQKRFAEDAARNDWILNLDADEWLPEAARAEIAALLDGDALAGKAGVRFRLPTVYPGDDRPRPFPDYHLSVRLYDRTRCRFPDSLVFDAIAHDRATMTTARAPIYHQTIRSLSHLVEKNKRYFDLQSVEVRRSKLKTLPRLLFEPFTTFFKYYVLRRHITGGWFGLKFALTIAYIRSYRLVVLAGLLSHRTEAARRKVGRDA
ncbi:MAG TPA: glycosyltransferase family 2 protein [Saliniramus sp.]|nr:glycosyltransferase family 2 protein [Saliniramus sp.]